MDGLGLGVHAAGPNVRATIGMITKLERAVAEARTEEEKRRRQLERALEGVHAAEARLRDHRAIADMRETPEPHAPAVASASAASPSGSRFAGSGRGTAAGRPAGPGRARSGATKGAEPERAPATPRPRATGGRASRPATRCNP